MCGCEEDDKRKAEAAKNKNRDKSGRASESSRSNGTPLEFENMGLTRGG